jgi:GTP-binding protein Era
MKCGFIGILGRPNVGKSTFINNIVGEKISIISPKPQTTRNKILGVLNKSDTQFVFIDTPGVTIAKSGFNTLLTRELNQALSGVDVLLIMVPPRVHFDEIDNRILKIATRSSAHKIILINKIDLVKNKNELIPLLVKLSSLNISNNIIPISCLQNDGLKVVLDEIEKLLPDKPWVFESDLYTTQSQRFLASEIIREKVFLYTHDEIPYHVACQIDLFKEEDKKIEIYATIYVSRDSQKGIIIGKNGEMIKKIRMLSEGNLKKVLSHRVKLNLFVKVKKNWQNDQRFLKELGYK